MTTLTSILLQGNAGGGGMGGLLMIVAMIAIFYLFMIRPQQKKQKEIKNAREAMRSGDKVVTAGGIHGRIRDIKDTTMMVEIAKGVEIKVDKTSVYPDADAAPVNQKKADKKKQVETKEEAPEEGASDKE